MERTPELLNIQQAAEYLGTSARFPRRLVEQRRIPFHKLGRHVRIARADLDHYLETNRKEAREW